MRDGTISHSNDKATESTPDGDFASLLLQTTTPAVSENPKLSTPVIELPIDLENENLTPGLAESGVADLLLHAINSRDTTQSKPQFSFAAATETVELGQTTNPADSAEPTITTPARNSMDKQLLTLAETLSTTTGSQTGSAQSQLTSINPVGAKIPFSNAPEVNQNSAAEASANNRALGTYRPGNGGGKTQSRLAILAPATTRATVATSKTEQSLTTPRSPAKNLPTSTFGTTAIAPSVETPTTSSAPIVGQAQVELDQKSLTSGQPRRSVATEDLPQTSQSGRDASPSPITEHGPGAVPANHQGIGVGSHVSAPSSTVTSSPTAAPSPNVASSTVAASSSAPTQLNNSVGKATEKILASKSAASKTSDLTAETAPAPTGTSTDSATGQPGASTALTREAFGQPAADWAEPEAIAPVVSNNVPATRPKEIWKDSRDESSTLQSASSSELEELASDSGEIQNRTGDSLLHSETDSLVDIDLVHSDHSTTGQDTFKPNELASTNGINRLVVDSQLNAGNSAEVNTSVNASFEPLQNATGLTEVAAPKTVSAAATESVVKQVVETITTDSIENIRDSRKLTLQIHPAELGRLEIQIGSESDILTAQIVASEHVTSELLNREKIHLINALQEMGVDLPDVEISYRNEDQENPFESQAEKEQTKGHAPPNEQGKKRSTNQNEEATSNDEGPLSERGTIHTSIDMVA